MDKPAIGAQLYTVRNFCKTLDDIAATLGKLRKIGYSSAQLSGLGPVKPGDLAEVIRQAGIRIAGTHVSWNRLQNETDAVIEEHRLWNCADVVIPGLPQEYFSGEGLRRFVRELEPICERLAAAGLRLSYHNHNHELAKYGGKTWLAALFELASPAALKAELDTYWIQAGGGDPAEWINRYPGRQAILHVKDMAVGPDRVQRFAEIGEGNLNWPAILQAAERAGVQYLMVEQDDCYGRDPFESLAMSWRFLRGKGYR